MKPVEYQVGDVARIRIVILIRRTVGSIERGSQLLYLADPTGYAAGDIVLVEGAGHAGGDHISTVNSVAGQVATLNDPAPNSLQRTLVGELADPVTLTFTFRSPETGTESSPAAVKDAVGRWHADVPVTEEGVWRGRALGNDPAPGAIALSFLAYPDPFT